MLIFNHRLLLHHIRWFRFLIPALLTAFSHIGTTMAGVLDHQLGVMDCRWMSTETPLAGVIMETVHITIPVLDAIKIQEIM
jgi:hypothetical protein